MSTSLEEGQRIRGLVLDRAVAGKTLLAVLVLVVAMVSPARGATVSFTPAFSTNLPGEGTNMSAELTLAGSEYHGIVAPLTKLTLYLPTGMGGSQSGFPTCPKETLEAQWPAGCPAGSMAGSAGSVKLAFVLAGTVIEETATLQALFAPEGELLFYLDARTPVSIQLALSATDLADVSPYGQALELQLPLMPTLPEATLASITALTIDLGATRKQGLTTINSLLTPAQCPQSGRFVWAAEATLHEGQPDRVTAETPCTNSSSKAGTPTTGGGGATGGGGNGSGHQVGGKKPPTERQRLSRALKACRKLEGRKRKRCETRARKRYPVKATHHR